MTEDRIDVLLAECLEHGEDVWSKQVDDRCAAHPDLATELRRRFESLMMLGLIDPPRSDAPRHLGKYEIVRELGGGSMGVVYLATDTELGRQVALKVIRPEQLPFRSARERFQREMVAASRIDHPSVCPIYEAGEHDGTPFLAMRYVVGRSMADWLAANRPGSDSESGSTSEHRRARIRMVCEWFAELGDGLHTAHESGFVHRDIKPGNVLIPATGSPVLVDFGLARLVESENEAGMTATGVLIGTPAYMAPEQIQEHGEVGPRTDVYTLGLTMRECLTLRPAFEATGRESLYRQILTSDLVSARSADGSIPEDLSLVVAKATAKDPSERYSTAKEFADDLRRILRFEPIVARRPPLPLRARRWIQRNPVISSTMAVSIVGLVVALVLLVSAIRSARESEALAKIVQAAEEREQPGVALDRAADALAMSDDPLVVARAQEITHRLRFSKILRVQGGKRVDFARWSPDNAYVVAGGQDVDSTIFRADGTFVAQIQDTANGDQQPTVAFRRDEVVFAERKGSLRIHALDNGEPRRRIEAPAGAWQAWCICANDSAILAVHPVRAKRGIGKARLWVDGTARALSLDTKAPSKWIVAAMLPDGRIIASGCVWSSEGRKLQTLRTVASRRVTWISAYGNRVAISSWTPGAPYPQFMHLFSIGDRLEPVKSPRVKFRPHHRAVVGMGPRNTVRVAVPLRSGYVYLLDPKGNMVDACQTWNGGWVSATAFSQSKPLRVVTGNWAGAVQMFSHAGVEYLRLQGHVGGVTWAEFRRGDDTRLLTSAWDGTARIWELDRFPSRQMTGCEGGLAASPDGTHVVIPFNTGEVRLCNAQGEVIHTRDTELRVTWLNAGYVSRDEVLIGDVNSGEIFSWNTASDEWKSMPKSPVLKASPPQRLVDGRLLVRGKRNLLSVYEPDSGWQPFLDKVIPLAHFAVSRDGRLVATQDWRNQLRVFDWNGKQLHQFEVQGLVHGLDFSSDGHLLAAASSSPVVYLFDLPADRLKNEFGEHGNGAHDVAFSPDGTRLATGSADGMLRVFDIASGRQLIEIRADERRIGHIAFLNDNRLVTSGTGGFARWWMLDADDVLAEVERLQKLGPW